jgi:lipoprotein-releasing system permease protein
MPTRLELSIAWRYLRGRRASKLLSFTSLVAVGGVVVGVSALIVVMGIMNGLQHDLRDRLLIASPDITVSSASPDARIDAWQDALRIVEAQPGVVAAAPFVTMQCLANAGHTYMEFGNVIGLEPQSALRRDVTDIRGHMISGDLRFASTDGTGHGMALGKLIAANLNASVGDSVTLMCLGRIDANTGRLDPTTLRFEVTGIFETGLYDYDHAFMYIALPMAQTLAGLGGAVSGIDVRVSDRSQAALLRPRLVERLGPAFQAIDWQQQNKSLYQALNLEKATMGMILCLIVVVAALNIVSNLTMVVFQKTAEIGILKAMGMSARGIRRIFLAQGMVIGIFGTSLGLVVGVAVSLALGKYQLIKLDPEVYSIDHLPVATASLDVIVTIITSLAVAALATLYPSVQAGRLYPIDAIRHE